MCELSSSEKEREAERQRDTHGLTCGKCERGEDEDNCNERTDKNGGKTLAKNGPEREEESEISDVEIDSLRARVRPMRSELEKETVGERESEPVWAGH